jgi:hypothetical protein
MDLLWFLSNTLLITCILLRIPNTKAISTDIDKNPKFLNGLISILVGVFFSIASYVRIFN